MISSKTNPGFRRFEKKQFLFLFLILFILVGGVYFLFLKGPNPALTMVSGTEYISGEEGQIIVRLHDSKNNPLETASCIVSLLNPDKSFFLVDKQMIPTSVPGNYYTPFIVPQTAGIYEEHIRCDVSGKILFVSSSFHVSAGLNLVSEMFSAQQTQFQRVLGDLLVTQELLQNNVQNITQRLEGVELALNDSMEQNQQMLLTKFSQMGGAMENIFGNESL